MANYSIAGEQVSGLAVHGDIPNTSSIASSLGKYRTLPGVREVQFAAFGDVGPPTFYSVTEELRTKALANEIRKRGTIKPLIVVVDKKGPYVLEGGHRFDALKLLGKKSFPALVVITKE